MKVLVTGGLGKAGSWVVRELLEANRKHQVTVLDQQPGPEAGPVRYIPGSVADLGQVLGALAGCDAVIHLAAVPRPGFCANEVTFGTNVLGTFNVHEAAYRLGIRRVVTAGSQAILGWDYRQRDFPPEYLPVDEDHPVRPQDPYGLSKEVGEAIARSYARKGLETVVLRPNAIVTPDQLEEIARSGGRTPDSFRLCSYIDARDFAAACRLAVEQPVEPGTVLFIVADDTIVGEPLCQLLPKLMPGLERVASGIGGTSPAISNARAKEVLGWQPKYSWRDLPSA
jgi:nucleoside-diphosphate-sugar epimerase